MTKIENWGAQYAMLLRRRAQQSAELARTEAELTKLRNAILDTDQAELYAPTGEHLSVGDERPTATLTPPWLGEERGLTPRYERVAQVPYRSRPTNDRRSS